MITVTEDYVSFEVAKLLKEKGFDNYKEIRHYYSDSNEIHYRIGITELMPYQAPTLQMVMKWLREVHGIAVIPIISSVHDFETFLWQANIVVAKTNDTYSQRWVYEKQEEACEVAIKYCLENLL